MQNKFLKTKHFPDNSKIQQTFIVSQNKHTSNVTRGLIYMQSYSPHEQHWKYGCIKIHNVVTNSSCVTKSHQ